jgi:hypothetical protein
MRELGPVIRIGVIVLVGLLAVDCSTRPAAGETCRVPDQTICAAHDRALVCDGRPAGTSDGSAALPPSQLPRTWVEVSCKGARGCATSGGVDECDDTLAADGDRCPHAPPLDYACGTDLVRALVCKDGRFGLWRRCRGPQGCQILGGRNVHCDTSLGEPGDPCERAGTYACAVDRKTMLQCDGQALALASSCRGDKGCSIEQGEGGAPPRKIDCDDRVALEGDVCAQARRITCAVDHKEELVCDGKRFAKKRECLRSDCRIEGTELFCD